MSFIKYKEIGQVQKEFGITAVKKNFVDAEKVEPSKNFVDELNFTLETIPVRFSEAARTETLIFPILKEAYKNYKDKFILWIQRPIFYTKQLSGTPDYLIATKSPLGISVFEKPFLAVVEAKKNDFEEGWGQCLAELVAVQNINGDENKTVYGIVTDGENWQFGKLEKKLFTQNNISFALTDLPTLFGAIHFIFKQLNK